MNHNPARPHIGRIENFARNQQYTYPRNVVVDFKVKQRNRSLHGARILQQLNEIRQRFQIEESTTLQDEIIKNDVIYVQFISEWGYKLNFDQLNQNSEKPNYLIVNIKQEEHPTKENHYRYVVTVMLTKGGISHFIKKAEQYLRENTRTTDGSQSNVPRFNSLIANINIIRLATLQAFWTDEPEISFPQNVNEVLWWEVWFRKTSNNEQKIQEVEINLNKIGANRSRFQLDFPEHVVKLVQATANQLSQSLVFLDNLAELRHPQELSDFVLHDGITLQQKEEILKALISRTDFSFDSSSVLICLLDSGVNNRHPMINPALPDDRLYTWNEAWGKFDSERGGGHGTGMAGLSLYGDLSSVINRPDRIILLHGLESFKIYNPGSPNEPEIYGAVYEYGCSAPFVENPNNPRVFCLSVTNKDFTFNGRPSSSSASIDKIAFGKILDPPEPQLVLVSSGNVIINSAGEYPDKNYYESIQDPGQAYNAITVGSYTCKNIINPDTEVPLRPLAPYGGIAPSNSSSATWETQWPNKPDIVMEGGNLARNGMDIHYLESLRVVTTHKEPTIRVFQTFGDTSAAVALASKLAAELRTIYPNFWPETIRGLIIHSAEWTPAMLDGHTLSNEADRRSLLRSVGYGVPNFEKAKNSASNSLTLIAQNTIQPYLLEVSTSKYNEYHLYELPWPADVLHNDVGDQDAKLTVTLSYFIEPNPGKRQYASNFRYHSHELEFKLIKPLESLNDFRRRISASTGNSEDSEEANIDASSEIWTIKERVRSKGSIKKDYITTSGIELSRRNYLAVYPKNGWYKTRKKLDKVNSIVRYSLIISVETPSQEIDLYTPVLNMINISIPAVPGL